MSDRLADAAARSFRAKIEGRFDWRAILRELDAAEPFETDGGGRAVSVFLGSVFSLAPSGKYYTPFANSNVNDCAKCAGGGKSKRTDLCGLCEGKGARVALAHYNLDGLAELIGRRVEVGETFDCNGCAGAGRVPRDCHHCGGTGSREAWLDSIFWEELEKKAESLGCFVEFGEGNATDVFICRAVDDDDSGDDAPDDDGAPAEVGDCGAASLDAAHETAEFFRRASALQPELFKARG